MPEVRTKWVKLQWNGEYAFIPYEKLLWWLKRNFSWCNEDKIKMTTVPAIEGVPSRSRDVPFNSRLWKEWCWWQNSRSTWHLDRACPVSLTAAITSNEWDVRALDRYLLQFYLDRSWNREVSWYHLNQISNPTVRTIKVTGLENLYRKDDKYISKRSVLFNLWYILISVDCRSTRLSEKSSCHPTMIRIVRLLSIDSWMSMKETL